MGYLLSLSGLDGSGKTTQAEHISDILKKQGLNVEVIHFKTVEPKRYLPRIKNRLQQYIAGHCIESKEETHQICCAYLFCEKVMDKVWPSLCKNDLTILDRYRDSALCYHYLQGGIYPSVQQIYNSVTSPNKNIFLDLSPEDCFRRIQSRESLSPFETPNYLEKAYAYYQSNRERFIWINAAQAPETITWMILSEIGRLPIL